MASTSLRQPYGETATTLLQRRIPSLLTRSSTHSVSYNGDRVNPNFIKPWRTFKTDLLPYLQRYTQVLQNVRVPRMDTPEILLTGGEICVQGRFLQHVGLAVSLCMREIPSLQSWRFGDVHYAPST